MASISDITGLAEYLGITPDRATPLLLLFFAIAALFNKKLSPINKVIKRISNAIIEIQTVFKTAGYKLSHLLVEAPGSPLSPTEYGAMLIKESGLETILNEKADSILYT